VIVAARDVSSERLTTVVGAHRSDGDTTESRALLGSIVATVFAQRVAGVLRSAETTQLQHELAALREQLAGAERVVANRDARLTAADQERERLLEEIRDLRESLTNRVIAKVRRSIGSSE
jgi:chromosome segregation ATPase